MWTRAFAALGAVLLCGALGPPASADDLPDPADPTAVLDITKSVSPGTVGPGDEVTYTIQVGCSAISDVGCRNAITTDVIPPPLVIDDVVPSGPNEWGPPEIDGQKVTVSWVESLGGSIVGMLDNQTSQITITAHVPEDVPYDLDGTTITNLATAEATNAVDVTDSAQVILDIPLDLATSATKEFDPATAIAGEDTAVTAALAGTNDSNATVDSLVIQDPTNPAVDPNPFTYLGFQGFGTVVPPPGTSSSTYEVYVGGGWVEVGPDGVPPAPYTQEDVRGARVTFDGSIPPGETGTVDLDLATTDAAAAVDVDTPVTNNIQSQVVLDGDSAQGTASDTFTIQANAVDVAATKSFDPDLVVAGQSSTVTVGGSNESAFNIDSLTITEPSSGSFPDAYELDGIGPITYPANATGATVTYQPGNRTAAVADGAAPAEPAGGWDSVDSFSVEFTGPIIPGAEATVPFDVATDPDFEPDVPFSAVPNEVAVEGDNDGATADATAADELLIYGEVINTYVDKTIRPSEIVSEAGQILTVSLAGGTTERPTPDDPDDPNATTGRADQVIVQDPEDPLPNEDPFWNAFDLESIAQTPVPADANLTIQYYDTETGEWVTLEPPGTVAGATIVSQQVPDDVSEVAGGVRFVYDYTGDAGGFEPGTDFEPNFTASLRDDDDGRYFDPAYDADDPDQLTNCAQTDATSPTEGVPDASTTLSDSDTGCPEIDLIPPDGDGGAGDLIEKDFGISSSGGDASVIARSGDTIPSTLSWSTAGYTGYERVRLQDVPDETDPVATTVYDAFNLIRVDEITATDDPFLTYDQITAVQLYDGTGWDDAELDPCPAACDGTFPGMDLTPVEQQSTLAVRLVYEESPTRGGRSAGDLDAPPVGSGVARSNDHARHVTLLWQVRDTHRSTPGRPALGDESPAPASTYNTGSPGLVDNDASATAIPQDGGAPVVGTDDDQVLIIDVPITQTTAKDWLGGPVAIPSTGTPADQYPRSRLRIRTTNTTPARVDQLQITDPSPASPPAPGQSPFDYFDLVRIAAINVPSGATSTEVVLTCADGTTRPTGAPGFYTREQALALTTMPCDVVGFEVLFDGRIASGANGAVALDLRLRATNRTTGADIVAGTDVSNTAQGIVADVDAIQDCPPGQGDRFACGDATAGIQIVAPTFGIEADKRIEPDAQTEGEAGPVTVTVSAQNTGSARPYVDEITDDDATFWNAMDFVQMDPSWTLPSPVQVVQACYLSGGTFTDASVSGDTVGGAWTCQALPGGGPPFVPGVDLTLAQARAFIDGAPADLHGLRFRFMASNDVGFQNPVHPLIEVPFQVQRRTDLRSGGPVPTTRADQTPAPGEDTAGVFEDTVDVHGESALVGPDPDDRLTDDASEDATYTYEHLTIGVEVEKSPGGELPPGQVIPFELSYTNTGDAPLHNPVFTDVLPSDSDGNQLIFDPDSDPAVNSPYEFELDGAPPSPPNGDPLPTDQDDIAITQAGDTITFAMPEGTVLEVGQTYTITIDLVLRPGLTPDDELVNTATVVSDEPFDPSACSPTYDQQTGECEDSTRVSPTRVAALTTVKRVKADVPVVEDGIPEIYLDRDVLPEGITVPDDYCDTAGDADGFYRAPCVPMTYPGDTETWRFTITNAGTIPIDQLVSIDNLPYAGDQGVIVNLPRDSEWPPTFAGGVSLITSEGTELGVLTTYYSSDRQPCVADLRPLGAPCDAGDWTPWDGSVDPADVASLKFVVDFPVADLFDPGEQVTIQYRTRTTPTEPADSTYPVAWNSVATGGTSNDAGTRANLIATEGRKAGVTYPTGLVELQKVVTGDGAAYAPDSFDVQLECTVDGEQMTGLPVVTLPTNGDPVEVDGLPWGAECTASEADQGQTSDSADTAVVGGPEDDVELITVTNVFDLGAMSVTKTVESDAVDGDGDPIEYGPFEVRVTCEFLDEEVWGADFTGSPMVVEIEDGETVRIEGLPVGAECTVTEPDDAGAGGVDIDPSTVTIGGDGRDPDVVESVTVTNTFGDGSLRLVKQVDGPALDNTPGLADGPFTMHVECTLTDASHPDGQVVYDDDVVLSGVAPDNAATIEDLPTDAVCEVTETDDGGATSSTVAPGQVTIGDGSTITVTATNTFRTGSMRVTKAVDSDAVDEDGDPIGYGPFQVSVSCRYGGEAVFGDGYDSSPMLHTIDSGETWRIDGLPIGSTCTVSEPDDADADAVDIAPDTVTISGSGSGDVPLVRVTNTFDDGSLRLVKVVDGPALDNNPALGEGPFTLHVRCVLTDASHPDGQVVYDADVVLAGPQPLEVTIDDLASGAVCDVTETDDGGATDSTVTPGQVTVGDGTTVDVTAANTFEVGPMSVTKTVTSDAVDQDGIPIGYGPFQVSVTCRYEGRTVLADGFDASPMLDTISDGGTWELTGLPIGSRCTVREPDAADAASVDISPSSVVIEDQEVPAEVAVENTYGNGSLHLRKRVFPEAVEEFAISEGPFTLHLTCTLTDASHPDGAVVYDDDILLEGPQPLEATVDNIAAGAVCVVTEPDPGASTAQVIAPRQVVVRDDVTVNVVATNLFGRGALTVTKAIDGPGADRYGGGPFEVSVSCTYTDVDGDQVPLNTPGGPTRDLSADNDYTATYEPLLLGSTCTIEETATGGATSTVIADADGNEVSEFTVDSLTEAVQLDVTNTFDVGSVTVKKQVIGPGPDRFTVELACVRDVDGTATDVDIPGGAERPLTSADDYTARYDDLPTGAECTLVESDDGGAAETTITPNNGAPEVGTVVIGDGTTVRLHVVNRFDSGVAGTKGGTQWPSLPGTGAGRWLVALMLAGLALVGCGALLVTRSRRRT